MYKFLDEQVFHTPGKRPMIKEIKQEPNAKMKQCFYIALSNGHTTDEAEECDDFSMGCPNCPFGESR